MKPRDRILRLLAITDDPLSAPEIADICGLWDWQCYWHLAKLQDAGFLWTEWDTHAMDYAKVYKLNHHAQY